MEARRNVTIYFRIVVQNKLPFAIIAVLRAVSKIISYVI